jgi:hypothetical protein
VSAVFIAVRRGVKKNKKNDYLPDSVEYNCPGARPASSKLETRLFLASSSCSSLARLCCATAAILQQRHTVGSRFVGRGTSYGGFRPPIPNPVLSGNGPT